MDTIVALSTAPGRSAIGVIRVSGPRTLQIARSLVGDEHLVLKPGQVSLRSLQPEGNGEAFLDQALLTYFEAPNSYTGEDVLEISCHGSPLILRQVIDRVLKLDARLADPGEFTLRALENGKLNLTQAIAIRDLINARTDAGARQAVRQLKGELSSRMQSTKQKLIEVIVVLESALEFVEDDLPQVKKNSVKEKLASIVEELSRLASTFEVGHLLKDGLRVAIAGSPNVGKSSLFNALVAFDRAIVTDIPGTTRDSLSESITLEGFPVILTDTAGVRAPGDQIEQLGVARSHQVIADADLVLLVVDGTVSQKLGIDPLVEGTKSLVVRNKSDLPSFKPGSNGSSATTIEVSALTGAGLDRLRAAIIDSFNATAGADSGLLITDARQHDLLQRAAAEVEGSIRLLEDNRSEELIVLGLHNGLNFIGAITGETTTEEILTEIFSTFCIGK